MPRWACCSSGRSLVSQLIGLLPLVGLSIHLSCHSSRGFDFGWEMVRPCVRKGCGEGMTTMGLEKRREKEGMCYRRRERHYAPRGTGRGRVLRHLRGRRGMRQERGEQVLKRSTIEEGEQRESVHPILSVTICVFPPLRPFPCTPSTEKIDQYGHKTQELTFDWLQKSDWGH